MSQQTPLRWLRFSLKSLFLLILVVAAYFGGWRSALWRAEREKNAAVRKAVEELQAAREKTDRYDAYFASGSVYTLRSLIISGGIAEGDLQAAVQAPPRAQPDSIESQRVEDAPPPRDPRRQP